MRPCYDYWSVNKHISVKEQCDWSTITEDNIKSVTINDQGINMLTDEFFTKIRNAKQLFIQNTLVITASISMMHQLQRLQVICNLTEYPPSIRKLTQLSFIKIGTNCFGTQSEITSGSPLECTRLVNELADFFEEREGDKARILHVIWCMRGYNKDIVKDVVAYMTAIMYAKKFTWRK